MNPNERKAARDVLAERDRQTSKFGITDEHDDRYIAGQLAMAAGAYIDHVPSLYTQGDVPSTWPWDPETFRPENRRRNLVKAGALILAEIERLDRAVQQEPLPEPIATDPFADVRDQRIGELNAEQRDRAYELWSRNNIGWLGDRNDLIASLHRVIDRLRAAPAVETKPCRGPYCECDAGKCTHPGFHDARGIKS